MIRFEDRDVPEDAKGLAQRIEQDASAPFSMPIGDVGDSSPLDWVPRLVSYHPELASAVDDAYAQVLAAGSTVAIREVLVQLLTHSREFAPRLAEVVARNGDALQANADPHLSDGTTLLGTAVRTLDRLLNQPIALAPKISDEAVRALAAIDEPADGWPESFHIALKTRPREYLEQLVPTLQQLDDDQLGYFAGAMIADGAPLTEEGFERVGRGPEDLRDRFAAIVQKSLLEAEASRKRLLSSSAFSKYPPHIQAGLRQPRTDIWPQLASRLGVPV